MYGHYEGSLALYEKIRLHQFTRCLRGCVNLHQAWSNSTCKISFPSQNQNRANLCQAAHDICTRFVSVVFSAECTSSQQHVSISAWSWAFDPRPHAPEWQFQSFHQQWACSSPFVDEVNLPFSVGLQSGQPCYVTRGRGFDMTGLISAQRIVRF